MKYYTTSSPFVLSQKYKRFLPLLCMALMGATTLLLPQKCTAQSGKPAFPTGLHGLWSSTDGSGHLERWDSLSPTHLRGFAYSMENGEQKVKEYFEITESNGVIACHIVVPGQNEGRTVAFELTQNTNGIVVFENARHDFPNRISYHFTSPHAMQVNVSGSSGRGFSYDLHKQQHAMKESTPMAARYTAYNTWANKALAEWISQGGDEVLNREMESSFSSLRHTILHIWSAEYLWLQVLKGESYEANPTRDFAGTPAELMQGWLEASADFQKYVEKLGTLDLQGSRGSGSGQPLSVADIIQHCMNHSTYHRGQLITMGRQAGLLEPPATDFIRYVRM